MITNAQTEAVLKLANALEDCERLGVRIDGYTDLKVGPHYKLMGRLDAACLRAAIADLAQKKRRNDHDHPRTG